MPKATASIVRLVALALAIGGLAAGEIWRSYLQTTTRAERSVASLASLLAEQTERTIQAIDFTLIGMRDALQIAPSLPPNDPTFQAALNERLKSLPYVRTLYVVGRDGFTSHDTNYPEAPRVTLADRDYFQVHQSDANAGLHIGRPLLSRSVGLWFISFSRRINNADGSFAGVVVAALEPAYFKRLYEGISVDEESVIALLHRDGTLLARTPHYEQTIGTSHAGGALYKAARSGHGVMWLTSLVDGVRRVCGFRTLTAGPMMVVVGWSEDTIYDAWRRYAAIVGFGSVLVLGLIAGLSTLRRTYQRRERVERARLTQAKRLEMMGRIAGGIAHDLGNTIKIARTTFTLLRPSLGSQREAMALVDDADRSLKSAFDIIDRLLAFARRQELSPRATDLGALIAGFAPILRQAASPRVELDLDLNGGRPLVSVIDPIHLESALLNLVLNSKEAMPDGGHIVVVLREAEAPCKRGTRRGLQSPAPPWAEIAVRDTGVGMSRHVQEHAFEPFFTTRAGGSGLGLSQVLGFVQQSDGDVRIESQVGAGTTVSLLFPTAADAPDPVRPAVPAGSA